MSDCHQLMRAILAKRLSGVGTSILLIACVVSLGCKSDEDRYIDGYRSVESVASLVGKRWGRSRSLSPADIALRESRFDREQELLGVIRKGFSWESLGTPIDSNQLAREIGVDAATLRLDAWGTPFEFRQIDGFLAIRSAGPDRVFEEGNYREEEFVWPSGHDLVFVAESVITMPKDHWKHDDWFYRDDE